MDLNRYHRQEADLTTVRYRWLQGPQPRTSDRCIGPPLVGAARLRGTGTWRLRFADDGHLGAHPGPSASCP